MGDIFRSSSSSGFPSKVCRSEGVAAPVEDLWVESILIPRRNTRSMLFRIRLAGPAESGETGLNLTTLLCDSAGVKVGADIGAGGATPDESAAAVLVLIVVSGFPPIGSNSSRLCFILFGAEKCLRSSSSLTFCVADPPWAPTDSAAVDVGACVLPERFSELCDRRGLRGWS